MTIYIKSLSTAWAISTSLFVSSVNTVDRKTPHHTPSQYPAPRHKPARLATSARDIPTVLVSNQPGAGFGFSLSAAGDVNGDGYADAIVGAFFFDNIYQNEGAAFLYPGSATGLATTPIATITGNQTNAELGLGIASVADVNADGYDDVIIAAPLYDNGHTNEGAVFLYLGSPTGLATTPAAQWEGNQQSARFGNSIASAGDINGDGYNDIIIGANQYDQGQTNEGAAFIYLGSPAGLSPTPATILESNQPDAAFGTIVASAGDINADGYADIIVGAPHYSQDHTKEGAAWIYHGSPTGLTLSVMLQADQAAAAFGSTVASAGDVNNDTFADILIGAPGYDHGETDEGAAFLYLGGPTGLTQTPAFIHESNQPAAAFATSLTSLADTNNDGYSDYLIGSYTINGSSANGTASFFPGGSGPLPVKLKSFTAHAENCNAILSWSAATELNLSLYTIEASINGTDFTSVGKVPAHKNENYTYTAAQSASVAYYRLKMIDTDGSYTHSALTIVRTNCHKLKNEEALKIYPNPATSSIWISGQDLSHAQRITLSDPQGRAIIQYNITGQVQFDISTLQEGTYYIHIDYPDERKTAKLIIAR